MNRDRRREEAENKLESCLNSCIIIEGEQGKEGIVKINSVERNWYTGSFTSGTKERK